MRTDVPFFDAEKLTNPYSDTRICAGDSDSEIRGLLVGIDMEVGEVLLADRLREKGEPIDLVFAHHPEGPGYANLHEVMYMQADLWAAAGRFHRRRRRADSPACRGDPPPHLPVNHYRAIDAAKLLGLASLSCHTPADNSVQTVRDRVPRRRAARRRWMTWSRRSARSPSTRTAPQGLRSRDRPGTGSARPGRMVVDMTGGTEGPKEALDRLSAAGVGTLVGMHYSEEHRKHAEELKLNLVVAGHISSDVLGMNLVLDRIEALGRRRGVLHVRDGPGEALIAYHDFCAERRRATRWVAVVSPMPTRPALRRRRRLSAAATARRLLEA